MTNSEDLPVTEESAAMILARLQAANPKLMEETIASLPREQRDVANASLYASRRR